MSPRGVRRLRRTRLRLLFGGASLLLTGALLRPPEPGLLGGQRPLRLVAREGIVLREFRDPRAGSYRDFTPLEDFPPALVEAVLAAEDGRFYDHPGFDPLALARATHQNLRAGRVVSGASTLSQQTARIVYAERLPAGLWARKVLELFYALRLEAVFSKEEILEAYLNRVPLPANRSGFPAAAAALFQRDVRLLTAEEGAALVVLLRRHHMRPARFRAAYLRLARRLKAERGLAIDASERTAERLAGAVFAAPAGPRSESQPDEAATNETAMNEEDETSVLRPAFARAGRAPHFVDWLRSRFPGLGGRVATEISAELNQAAAEILQEELLVLADDRARDGAVVVLEIDRAQRVLRLRVLVGSPAYDADRAGQVNGATALRSAGSSLKPFVYGLGMDRRGLRPYSIVKDEDISIPLPGGATYRPRNYDLNYWGPITLREALATSRNVPAVALLHELGAQEFLGFLRKAGLEHLESADPDRFGPGLALGSAGITLFDLTRMYGALAARGRLWPVRLGRSAAGDELRLGPRRRLLSERAALQLTHILSDAAARRRSFGRLSFLDFPFPVAAKTGTSKDYRDAWTVGYTPQFIVGVWVGNMNGETMNGISGAFGAGRVFHQVLRLVAAGRSSAFEYPADWRSQSICRLSGLTATASCPALDEFIAAGDEAPRRCSGLHRLVAEEVNESEWTSPGQDGATAELMTGAHSVGAESIVVSPVTEEVYLLDPHSPREIQLVPLHLRAPDGARYAFRLDEGPLRAFRGEFREAVRIVPGRHRLVVYRNGRAIESVEFAVE